jgi:hypothetical protein
MSSLKQFKVQGSRFKVRKRSQVAIVIGKFIVESSGIFKLITSCRAIALRNFTVILA